MHFRVSFLLLAGIVSAQTEREKLHKIFDETFSADRDEMASRRDLANGRIELTGKWRDMSTEGIERFRAGRRDRMRRLQALDVSSLDATDRFNYRLLSSNLKSRIRLDEFPADLLWISQYGNASVIGRISNTLMNAPTTSLRDYENLLAQIRSVAQLLEQVTARLEDGRARGVTVPRATVRDLPRQLELLSSGDPLDHPFLEPFRNLPASISEMEQERLKREAAALTDSSLMPAIRKLREYLINTYIPQTRETIGRSDLPEGPAWYRAEADSFTTTQMTPQQIHKIGLSEVKRIRAAMDSAIAASGYKGTFEEFQRFLRTDPRFYFTDGEEYLRACRELCKRIDAELPKLFKRLPRAPYGVRAIPDFAAPNTTTAYYTPPPRDGTQPGWYNVNLYKLEERPKFEMEALTLHESVPGHHLQLALQNEIENRPRFRELLNVTAFTEGWGLYAESLGEALGLYRDPYSKFGALSYDMWRACRLVVDTGMHAMGWPRQRAIDFMKANTALTEQNIVAEVDRYISWPGQALGYKIGELKIKELRRRAERELGDKFDLREFHDAVLKNGAIPLDILEEEIDAWIKSERAKSQK